MNFPFRRPAVRIFLGLFLLSRSADPVSGKTDERELAVALPRLGVSAGVPLVKIADFRMREKRFAPAAVTDGRYIYIIGGTPGSGAPLETIERFDPVSGTSEEFAKLHTGRFWHQAVIHAGKIYVLGGSALSPGGSNPATFGGSTYFDELRAPPAVRAMISANEGDFTSTNSTGLRMTFEASVEIIDLATRQVTRGAPMLVAQTSFSCVTLGDELYVIGGKRLRGGRFAFTNAVQVYSFATGKWRDGLNMPTPRATPSTLVDGPFIVVPGGYNGIRELDVVEAFDPRTDAWIVLPKLCRPVSAHSLVFLGHFLFLFGNYEAPGELVAYDLVTKKSEAFTLQYTPARHTAAVVVNGRVYVIGGKVAKDADALDLIQVFAPPLKSSSP